jgi:hypothetical protein
MSQDDNNQPSSSVLADILWKMVLADEPDEQEQRTLRTIEIEKVNDDVNHNNDEEVPTVDCFKVICKRFPTPKKEKTTTPIQNDDTTTTPTTPSSTEETTPSYVTIPWVDDAGMSRAMKIPTETHEKINRFAEGQAYLRVLVKCLRQFTESNTYSASVVLKDLNDIMTTTKGLHPTTPYGWTTKDNSGNGDYFKTLINRTQTALSAVQPQEEGYVYFGWPQGGS